MFGARAGHPMPSITCLDENGNEVKEFGCPSQKEINEQGTPFFWACWDLNMKIEHFGLPHGRGWLYERPTVLQIRQICVSEQNRYDAWRNKEGRNLEDRD